eukprot:TRINITY_DN6944_c0_g1_i1.p1 TRINITY_DN6944_c0_g1~~TRINITY_DN6944_c0_g1_i1.p1  ORF type:complete len:317 (+),score=41.69 TRINITY_DN6944_c0_g1_i1:14-964(+)
MSDMLASTETNDTLLSTFSQDTISCTSISPSGRYLCAGTWDGFVSCRNIDGQVSHVLTTSIGFPVLCCCWAPDEKVVFLGGCSTKLIVWNLNYNSFSEIGDHGSEITHIFLLPEFDCIVSAGWSPYIKFWRNSLIHTLELPDKGSIVYSIDIRDHLLGVTTDTRMIFFYSLYNQEIRLEMERSSPIDNQIRCLRISPDCTGYALSSIKGEVVISDFSDNSIHQVQLPKRDNISPDVKCLIYVGDNLLIGDGFGRIFRMHWKQGRELLNYSNHGNLAITSMSNHENLIAFSTGYNWLQGTAGRDTTTTFGYFNTTDL